MFSVSHTKNWDLLFACPLESCNIKSYRLKQASPTHIHNCSSHGVLRHDPFKENRAFWPGTVTLQSKYSKSKGEDLTELIFHAVCTASDVNGRLLSCITVKSKTGGIFLQTYTHTEKSAISSTAYTTKPLAGRVFMWLHKFQHSLTLPSDLDSQISLETQRTGGVTVPECTPPWWADLAKLWSLLHGSLAAILHGRLLVFHACFCT